MSSSFNLLDNAELDRILRINLPARRLLFVAGLAVATVMVVSGLQWNSFSGKTYWTERQQVIETGKAVYWNLTVILFGLMFVLAPTMTALSVIQEKLRGTAIFQQMILMKPFDIALGKMLGSGALAYVAVTLIMPFALLAAIVGELHIDVVFSLYLFLFIGGLSFQAIGLCVSAAVSSPAAEKGLRGGLLVGPGVGLIGAVTGIAWHSNFSEESSSSYYLWHFYGAGVQSYVVILGLLLFIGLWAFAGAVRMIKASQLVPLKPWPVWLFFATAEALLVGIIWGWQPDFKYNGQAHGTPPIARLLFYIFINWGALLILAASIALSRNRLREWWSAQDDLFGLFQRAEIRNSFKTFIIALGISLVGLCALWMSYHTDGDDSSSNARLFQLVPIAVAFTLTIAGALCFIQYCAMQRFRARAWAGVGLVVIFYLLIGAAGALFKDETNTANLVNPAIYAYELTEGDRYMDKKLVRYDPNDPSVIFSSETSRVSSRYDDSGVILHGFLAQGLLAFGCFGLAYLKWRRIEDEMMEQKG